MLAQRQRTGQVAVGPALHAFDCHELVELGHRPQRRDAQIEMRARRHLDVLAIVFRPMSESDDDRNAEIACHIERPDAAPRRGEDGPQIPHIAVADLIEIDLGTGQAVVPPDGVGIPLDEFEKTLEDRFLDRIAGGATVRVRVDAIGAAAVVEKVQKARRKIFEAFVAQRPDRRPLGFRRRIKAVRDFIAAATAARRRLLELGIAQHQNVVRMDRFPGCEIREPAGES